MTSVSLSSIEICVLFLRDARNVYGDNGLSPATEGAAGVDLRACFPDGHPAGEGVSPLEGENAFSISPGARLAVPSGLSIQPRRGDVAGFVYSRSGLGAVKGLVVAQGVGVIDPDYRGEITVFLLNTGPEQYTVRHGDRIAQLVFQSVPRASFLPVSSLEDTRRGSGGFGHTGRR